MLTAAVGVACLLVGVFLGMWNRASVCRRSYAAGVAATRESEANAHGYASPELCARLSERDPDWVLVNKQRGPTGQRSAPRPKH